MKIKAPKITFSYPSWIYPGSSASGLHYPTSCIALEKFPSQESFYITFGSLMVPERAYSVDVNVYHDDETLIDDNRTSESQTMFPTITGEGDLASITTMLLEDIVFSEPGIYKIVVTMFAGTVEEDSNEVVDKAESFLVVTGRMKPLIDGPDGK